MAHLREKNIYLKNSRRLIVFVLFVKLYNFNVPVIFLVPLGARTVIPAAFFLGVCCGTLHVKKTGTQSLNNSNNSVKFTGVLGVRTRV